MSEEASEECKNLLRREMGVALRALLYSASKHILDGPWAINHEYMELRQEIMHLVGKTYKTKYPKCKKGCDCCLED